VVVAARRLEQMADLGQRGAQVVALDISDEASIQSAVSTILERHGRVDVLVNNAGFGCYGSVEETPIEAARAQFEVNLFGLARLTQLLLPGMRERGRGRIINISSMAGKIHVPLGSWYHASKHALEGWSDCLRLELASFGIDVVIIEPGIIQSEFGDVMLQPLLARSGDGPYGRLARAVASAMGDSFKEGGGSPAALIGEVVAAAVRARRPRTRYAAGQLARPLILMRQLLGDRLYDWGVMRMMAKG
jgi:NAD(P)-dependent dehydrogenase (short-subunit alcohol dehydrogenase family)